MVDRREGEAKAIGTAGLPAAQLWWLRAACFCQVGGFGVAWPFEAVWMRDQGLGEAAIGAISSLSTGVLLLAGLAWGAIADRTGRPDRIVIAGCLGIALSLAALTVCHTPLQFMLYALGKGVSMPAITTLMPVLALGALGAAAQGRGYALYRIFGSLGYIGATLILPRLLAVPAIFWASATGLAAAVLPLSRLRGTFPRRRRGELGLRALLRQRELAGFLLAGFFFALAAPATFTFTAVQARNLGADAVFIGILAASQGIIAVIALPLTGVAVDRFGPRTLLWLGFLAQPARCLALAAVDDYRWLLAPQLFHFFTWAGFEVAGVLLATQLAQESNRGTAQSLFRSCQVLGAFVGAFLSGWLAEFRGFDVMFVSAAAAAACGWLLFSLLLARRRTPGAADG